MAGMAGIQACSDIISLLNTNWNATNTDNITPVYRYNWELKWQWRIEGTDLVILDYTETSKPSLYGLDSISELAVSIECYTAGFVPSPLGTAPGTPGTLTAHVQNMGNEVARILKANPRLSGYAMTYPTNAKVIPQDDRTSFSLFLDVRMMKFNP